MEKVKWLNTSSLYLKCLRWHIHKAVGKQCSDILFILAGIYEIFCKETFGVKAKNLEFGLQPYKIPETETVCWNCTWITLRINPTIQTYLIAYFLSPRSATWCRHQALAVPSSPVHRIRYISTSNWRNWETRWKARHQATRWRRQSTHSICS